VSASDTTDRIHETFHEQVHARRLVVEQLGVRQLALRQALTDEAEDRRVERWGQQPRQQSGDRQDGDGHAEQQVLDSRSGRDRPYRRSRERVCTSGHV
jgi:hypothetical protein